MKRYCLALDLTDDAELIAEYENWHREGILWPEVRKSILDSGIISMEIYRTGNRLFMVMETNDEFSFATKNSMDDDNAKVQEWEQLMWKYQQRLPWAEKEEKWVLMDKIFHISSQ